jgi:hypothetical protein
VIFVFSYSKTCIVGNMHTMSDCVVLTRKCINLFTLYIQCVDGTYNKYYFILSAYTKNSGDIKRQFQSQSYISDRLIYMHKVSAVTEGEYSSLSLIYNL